MTREPPPPPAAELEAASELWTAFELVESAGLLEGVTLEMWKHIPEDFCRDHELDNGRLIRRQSGSRGHQLASRRLANAIEAAARRAVRDGRHPCLTVSQDLDVRLWEFPRSTVRRPDVLVYRCLAAAEDLWAKDVLLAIEIVSPASRATDTGRDRPEVGFESKMTQYALARIEHYWIVWLNPDESGIASIEQWWLGPEYRGAYAKVATWTNGQTAEAISTKVPFPIQASWPDLEF